ncbi:MAG: hypothetical protein EAZ57_02860 [Cytophagales bacterium]|nr:MAG: hypothetical protein EAZ67_03325 [Cytophagales bacterium]TAF61699.1 MAG: hypothetical protein EAZ57_02860 [Cytophagales bacterium]
MQNIVVHPFAYAIQDLALNELYRQTQLRAWLKDTEKQEFTGFDLLFKPEAYETTHYQRPVWRVKELVFDDNAAPNLPVEEFQSFLKSSRVYMYGEWQEHFSRFAWLRRLGFKLVETRWHYAHRYLQGFEANPSLRLATLEDETALMDWAVKARNAHDRHHAEPLFSQEQADAYLAGYASAALRGFCTGVLVPQKPDDKAFVAYNQYQVWQTVVPQVGASLSKGCFFKILTEILHRAHKEGCHYAYANTQAQNTRCQEALTRLGFVYTHETQIWTTGF